MTEWLQVILLALTQGLTEFLPISSSAHLILLPIIGQFPDQGLAFDVSLHLGTLLAVLYYFRVKIKWMFLGFLKSLSKPSETTFHGKLAWMLILGSVPIAIGGLLFHRQAETMARSPTVIAYATIIFGILLYFSEKYSRSQNRGQLQQLTFSKALFIGVCQVLAIIPGTSRSGITLTGGLFLGLNKKTAATFSFLLSIPAIIMAGGYESLQLLSTPTYITWPYFILGIGLSGITAFFCIHFFLKLIEKVGLLPFVVYRIILGVALIYLF